MNGSLSDGVSSRGRVGSFATAGTGDNHSAIGSDVRSRGGSSVGSRGASSGRSRARSRSMEEEGMIEEGEVTSTRSLSPPDSRKSD